MCLWILSLFVFTVCVICKCLTHYCAQQCFDQNYDNRMQKVIHAGSGSCQIDYSLLSVAKQHQLDGEDPYKLFLVGNSIWGIKIPEQALFVETITQLIHLNSVGCAYAADYCGHIDQYKIVFITKPGFSPLQYSQNIDTKFLDNVSAYMLANSIEFCGLNFACLSDGSKISYIISRKCTQWPTATIRSHWPLQISANLLTKQQFIHQFGQSIYDLQTESSFSNIQATLNTQKFNNFQCKDMTLNKQIKLHLLSAFWNMVRTDKKFATLNADDQELLKWIILYHDYTKINMNDRSHPHVGSYNVLKILTDNKIVFNMPFYDEILQQSLLCPNSTTLCFQFSNKLFEMNQKQYIVGGSSLDTLLKLATLHHPETVADLIGNDMRNGFKMFNNGFLSRKQAFLLSIIQDVDGCYWECSKSSATAQTCFDDYNRGQRIKCRQKRIAKYMVHKTSTTIINIFDANGVINFAGLGI